MSGYLGGWEVCAVCGERRTPLGRDPCLGSLEDVFGACCGHGRSGETVYVYGGFGYLQGPAAASKMRELGGRPPAAAFEGAA